MSLALGVSASEPSRVVVHLLCDSSETSSTVEQREHPFPSVQSYEDPGGLDDNEDDGGIDRYHLVVQGPIHMQGTVQQAISYINHRINPKEQEPRMYFRALPAAPEQYTGQPGSLQEDEHSRMPLVELVISTRFRDDVQVQVQDTQHMDLFLEVIPHIRAQTFYLKIGSNGSCLPCSIAGNLDKALSNHPTLKRLWLQGSAQTSTEMDESKDNSIHFSIAASILRHPQACIQDIMVEGYGGMDSQSSNTLGDSQHEHELHRNTSLSKNMESFLQAMEENASVTSISFIKPGEILNINNGHACVTALVLRLGKTLCVNRSIEKLYLGNLLEYLSNDEMESFARNVRRMKRLKVLDLRLVHRLVLPRPDLRFGNHMQITPHSRHRLSNEHRPALDFTPGEANHGGSLLQPIVDALEENCSLIKIPGWKKYIGGAPHSQKDAKARKQEMEALENAMNYQLHLNRSRAKQFVHEPTISSAAWPLVLSKCRGNPTAMYYCLRYKVASVCR